MALNFELFRKIRDQITGEPQRFSMGTFEAGCGTTRCVAGWAIYNETGEALYAPHGGYSSKLRILFREHGDSMHEVGRELLGLTDTEADFLFYRDEETALEAVQHLAAGRIAEFGAMVADWYGADDYDEYDA